MYLISEIDIQRVKMAEPLEHTSLNGICTRFPVQYGLKDEAKYIQFGIATTSINLNLASKSCGYRMPVICIKPEESKKSRRRVESSNNLNYEAEQMESIRGIL